MQISKFRSLNLENENFYLNDPEVWRTPTRKGGHHLWSSDTHWCKTVVGQTIMVAPKPKQQGIDKMYFKHQTLKYFE